jgi:hypothetical protein
MGDLGRSKDLPLLLSDSTENFPASSDTYRRRSDSLQGNSISFEYSRFVLVDNIVELFLRRESAARLGGRFE